MSNFRKYTAHTTLSMRTQSFPLALLVVGMSVSGCVATSHGPTVTGPLSAGWYNDTRVYYITTDITDPPMARGAGVNLASRLRDAVPEYPKVPGTKDIIERVYKFPKGEQDAIFASIPRPLGASSVDEQYSPIWLLYTVVWKSGHTVETLKSEEAVLLAEEKEQITLTRTSIVINCPIIATEREGPLPGWHINP